jgi:hypothetical protein
MVGISDGVHRTRILMTWPALKSAVSFHPDSSNSEKLPKDMIVVAAGLPDRVPVPEYSEGDLPIDWNAPIPPLLTKDLGTTWAKLRTSLAISVPSAIVPDERNYLVNPLHPDFSQIKFSAPKPFVFDPRLKK